MGSKEKHGGLLSIPISVSPDQDTRDRNHAVLRHISSLSPIATTDRTIDSDALRESRRCNYGQPSIMCFQIVEVYTYCGCERQRYALDPCSSVTYLGQEGHRIIEKRLELGFICYPHLLRKHAEYLARTQAAPANLEAAIAHATGPGPHHPHPAGDTDKQGPDGSPSPPLDANHLYGVSQPIPIPQRKKPSYSPLRASQ